MGDRLGSGRRLEQELDHLLSEGIAARAVAADGFVDVVRGAAELDASAPLGELSCPRHGAWRSLVSALVWGTRGPEFKSRRPDYEKPR